MISSQTWAYGSARRGNWLVEPTRVEYCVSVTDDEKFGAYSVSHPNLKNWSILLRPTLRDFSMVRTKFKEASEER